VQHQRAVRLLDHPSLGHRDEPGPGVGAFDLFDGDPEDRQAVWITRTRNVVGAYQPGWNGMERIQIVFREQGGTRR